MRCGITLCSILPIHAEGVAALDALHVFGLSRYVLTLVTAGAHEMRLVHHAPGLRPLLPDVDVVLGNAHFDLVHVQHDPGLSGLFDDAVPRATPQAFLFGAVTPAPSPSHVGHSLLQFLGAAFPHEHEDCRLRGNQILRSLERDLDGSLAEEQGVVPDPRLHRQVLDVGAADLPRLIVHARGLGHGRARPGGHDPAALYLPALDRGRGEVETDVGALFALFGSDEHTVTDDDQTLGSLVRHGLQYTLWRPRRPRRRRKGDVDHVPRLTGPRASLLMRACRRGSRGPHSPSMRKGKQTCKTRSARLRRSSGAGFSRRYGAGSGAAFHGSSTGRRWCSAPCSPGILSGR